MFIKHVLSFSMKKWHMNKTQLRRCSPPLANMLSSVVNACKGASCSTSSATSEIILSDCNGMQVEVPKLSSFVELSKFVPHALFGTFQNFCSSLRIAHPTILQQYVLPTAIACRDLCCIAPTGCGKTISFLVPCLGRIVAQNEEPEKRFEENAGYCCEHCGLDTRKAKVCPTKGTTHPQIETAFMNAEIAHPQCIILTGSSQLALQVNDVCRALAPSVIAAALVRGSLKTLPANCDIVIGTCEQILPEIIKRRLDIKKVRTVVADEFDQCFEGKRADALKLFLSLLPKRALRPHVMLFSTTSEPIVACQAKFILSSDHVNITVSKNSSCHLKITETILMTSYIERCDVIKGLYKAKKLSSDQRTLVFCNANSTVNFLTRELSHLLSEFNVAVSCVSKKMTLEERAAAFRAFFSGASTLLVCTDLCSRGIDFRGVVYVVNYDFPLSFDTYLHRVGRCGRHKLYGYAYAFFQP